MTDILQIGTRVKSLRDPKIVGTVAGYGTLFPRSTIPGSINDTTVVYLIWHEGSPGSNALQPAVRVLDINQIARED